jgi:4a-hydroxytetrahydrobiopterin dehydratase
LRADDDEEIVMAHLLTPEARAAMMAGLPDWALSEDGKTIAKTFRFDGFVAAFGFMTRIALKAEALNHHPDWRHVYNRVEVKLTTYDKGGLTILDGKLAAMMDEMANSPALDSGKIDSGHIDSGKVQ